MDFQTQDQCKPIPEEGNYFKKEHILTWCPGGKVDLPDRRFLRFYAASDHALRKKQANDSTCLLIAAVDPADRIFIMPDTVWEKLAPDVMVEKMIDLMYKFHTEMWWAARDQISGSIEPFLRKRMKERNVFRPWDDNISETVDLVQRARSFQARTFMNMVYWPSHWQKWTEAEQQLLAFDNGAHDDVVAACAMLGLGMDRMVKPAGAKASNLPAKGSFAWHSFGKQDKPSSNAWR
jgi:predicted phage terminase large subunit-like protein